jgi:hypothetical protein
MLGLVQIMPFLKGGPGSGNFGHVGISGHQGGSAPGEGGDILYHGSSHKAIKSIMSLGIKPQANKNFTEKEYYTGVRKNRVFAIDNIDAAVQYGRNAGRGFLDTKSVVFKIEVPKDTILDEDERHYGDNAYMFKQIPKEWIKGYRVYGVNSSSDSPVSWRNWPPDKKKGITNIMYACVLIRSAEEKETVKGGPGSGHFGHVGRPGQIGGSASGEGSAVSKEEVTWKKTLSKPEVYVQFREKFGIKRSKGRIEDLNDVGNHFADLSNRFPGINNITKKHSMSLDLIPKDIIEVSSEKKQKRFVGNYAPYKDSGGRPIVTVATERQFEHNPDIFLDHGTLAFSVKDVVNHELGHHIESSMGNRRKTWDKIVEQNGGLPWFEKNLTRYSGTNNSEAFAESFTLYTHPSYKGDLLPKQVHSFIEELLTPKTNKMIGILSLIKGGPGSGFFGHSGRPGLVGGSASGEGSAAPKAADIKHYTPGQLTKKQTNTWFEEVKSWRGDRSDLAKDAIMNTDYSYTSVATKDGKLKGICSYYVTRNWVVVNELVTKEKGYGTQTLQGAIDIAAKNNKGIELYSLMGAVPFYKKVGFKKEDTGLFGGGTMFLTAPKCKELATKKKDLSGLMDLSEYEPEDGCFSIKKKIKGGPGSGFFGHAGRPGLVGGSSSEDPHSGSVDFKREHNINRMNSDDPKITNEFSKTLTNTYDSFPGVQSQLKLHKIDTVNIKQDIIASRSGRKYPNALGLYEVDPQARVAPILSISPVSNKEFTYSNDIGNGRYTIGGNNLGDVVHHELGHHMQFALGSSTRDKWDTLVKDNGGQDWLGSNVSTYARTSYGKKFMEKNRQCKYSEGFSESFTKFTNPNYQGDLPKPIHDFMTEQFKIAKKKSISKEWNNYLRGNNNETVWV